MRKEKNYTAPIYFLVKPGQKDKLEELALVANKTKTSYLRDIIDALFELTLSQQKQDN